MALIKKFAYFIIILGFLTPFLVLAAGSVGPSSGALTNPLDPAVSSFPQLIKAIANIVAEIGGVVAVIFIIYAGFLFVTARGDEKQLGQAKTTFYWTVIGTGVLLGAYAIASAVVNLVQNLN